MTEVRKIVSSYILYCEGMLVTMDENPDKINILANKIEKTGKEVHVKKITTTEQRIQEIGKNVFDRVKNMSQKEIENILFIRNHWVRKTLDLKDQHKINEEVAWEELSKEHGYKMSFSEFCQWTLDVSDFRRVNR